MSTWNESPLCRSMPVDGQVDRADVGRRGAVRVEAGRVDAFALVAVEVELDGHALGDAAGAAGVVRAVAEAAARWTQGGRARLPGW